MRKVGIFDKVDPSDREGLISKAYAVSSLLRVIAIIHIVLACILGVLSLMSLGALGLAYSELYGHSVILGGSLAVFITVIGFLISVSVPILMYWFTSKIKNELESDIVPNVNIAYIFMGLSVLSIVLNPNLINVLLSLFIIYLWFLIVDCSKKADDLYL